MKAKQEVWAIVPTRGGSRGLPEKNIRQIGGRPLLHFMLRAATGARTLSRVVLTTDNDKIARVASQVEMVEVLRHPPELSRPGKPSFGVFRYALQKLIEKGVARPKIVVLLRVTTPLCLSLDIDSAINLLRAKSPDVTSVLSVTRTHIHPKRVYVINHKGVLSPREETPEKDFPLPRQTFDDLYIRNGAIYATFPEVVLQGSLWGKKPYPYVMPRERSVNINDEIDFILAGQLLKSR